MTRKQSDGVSRVIEDVTKALLDDERGSSFTLGDLLFAGYDDGKIFAYEDPAAADYSDMYKRYGKARQIENALTLPVRQCNHSIKQGKAPQEAVDLIESIFYRAPHAGGMTTPMDMVIAQMTGAFTSRKAYFEKVLTVRDDGAQVLQKLAWRPASTCALQRDAKTGAFRGFRQLPVTMDPTPEANQEIEIEAPNAFVYVHGQHRDPMQGISDMDITYWCYQTQQKIRFLWYQFLEGQSLPKTIVKNQDPDQARKDAKKVASLRQGGIIGMGAGSSVDPFESSGKGADQFMAALKWLDSEASNSVMAGFLDLSTAASNGRGSHALSKDASDFYLMSRQAVTREMSSDITHYLWAPIIEWNLGKGVPVPEHEFAPLSEHDADQAFTLLGQVAAAPAVNLPQEFIGELVEKVAGYLDIDKSKVREGLESAQYKAQVKAAMDGKNAAGQAVAGVAGAVDTATRAVRKAQTERAAA